MFHGHAAPPFLEIAEHGNVVRMVVVAMLREFYAPWLAQAAA